MSNATEQREIYTIGVETPLEFTTISATKVTSTKFIINQFASLLRDAFADFVGCKLDVSGKELTVIALFRRDGEYGDNAILATELESATETGNSVIAKTRRMDHYKTVGDRYTLTQNGKDALLPLISRKMFSNQGKPNMGAIVKDYIDGAVNRYYGVQPIVYTGVFGITLEAICKIIYGSEQDGEEIAYICNPGFPIVPAFGASFGPSNNYVLWINRISAKELKATYQDLGITTAGQSDIITGI